MWFHKLQILSSAIRTADIVFTCDELVNVAINALPTKALATLAALDWLNHDVLAQTAVKESVVFFGLGCSSAILLQSFADLVFRQGRFSLQKQRARCILLFVPWNKLRPRLILSH